MDQPNHFCAVWLAAEPYLRARKNDVHVPLAFRYAERLVAAHADCNPTVVLLATLLHDCGWAVIDEERIFSEGFGKDMMKSQVRFLHEKEGARIAREVLTPLGYDGAIIDEVCAIIDGHDTRKVPLSLNDKLMKDADKLWRFDVVGNAIACDWFHMTPRQYADRVERDILPQLFSDTSKQIAREELARTRHLFVLDCL